MKKQRVSRAVALNLDEAININIAAEQYIDMLYKNVSEQQKTEVKQAFFSGALVLFDIVSAISAAPDEVSFRFMDKVAEELE